MVATKNIVIVGGYAIGPVHEENGQKFRLVDVVESRPRTDMGNRMVLVYPGQGLSQNEQKFWSETDEEGAGYNNDLSGYLNIFGTFEKADDKGNPFAGVITASKVVVVPYSQYSERIR